MSKTGITLLGISGSPRLKSTHYAVNEALAYAQSRHDVETDYFTVQKKTIGFCTHCDFCVRKRQGCIQDDAMSELYDKMVLADAWILGTPVYQGQVSGQLKTVLDRCRAVVARDLHAFRDKVGMGICIGGDRSGGQEPSLQSLIGFYLINEMIPVGRRRVRRQSWRRRLVARQGRRGSQGRRRGYGCRPSRRRSSGRSDAAGRRTAHVRRAGR